MIAFLLRYIKGYVTIRITGYSVERFINLCSHQNIHLWNLTPEHHSYKMNLYLSDFKRLRPIVRKTGVHVNIIHKNGFYFIMSQYKYRKLFVTGFLLFCILLYFYSGRLWQIDFKGNQFHSSESLTKYLNSRNIYVGMATKDIKCADLVKTIRENYDDIVWVSASKDQSRLLIHIKENETTTFKMNQKSEKETPKDLIASKAGKIKTIVTRNGIPQIHEGDYVKAGDILVSGKIPIKDDSDQITHYQYHVSDADVYASTFYSYSDTIKNSYQEKTFHQLKNYSLFIKFSSYMVEFPSISYKKYCELYQTEYRLPSMIHPSNSIFYGLKQRSAYEISEKKYTKNQLKEKLSLNYKEFCSNLEKKGVQITSNNVKIYIGVESSTAVGAIYTIEKISQAVDTKIDDTKGKDYN